MPENFTLTSQYQYYTPLPTTYYPKPKEENMAKQKLYNYAILHHTKPKGGTEADVQTELLGTYQTLATDESQVKIFAARDIPDEIVEENRLDEIEIVVRPF